MPFLAAADWFEILAALAFLVITGIAQLVQKRARERQGSPADDTEPAEPSPTPSGPAPGSGPPPIRRPSTETIDWEEQLRRLFQPETTPPAGTPAPPVLERTTAETRAVSPTSERALVRHVPGMPPAAQDEEGESSEGPRGPSLAGARIDVAAKLAAAARAFRNASNLDQIAAERMRAAHQRTSVHSTKGRAGGRVHRAVSLRDQLRNRQSVRQAVITASILHAPKALE